MSKRTKSNIIGTLTIILLLISFMLAFILLVISTLLLCPIIFVTMFTYAEMKEWYVKCRKEEIDNLFEDFDKRYLQIKEENKYGK